MTHARAREPLAVRPAAAALGPDDLAVLVEHQSRVLERLVARDPLPDVLCELALAVETLLPGCACSVLLIDEAGLHLRHGASPSLPEAYSRAIDGLTIGPTAGSCGTAAYRREQVVVEDILTNPLWDDFRDLAVEHGLRACWSSPIVAGGTRLLGTFALYHPWPYRPGARDLRLIDHVRHLAAIAIEHDRLYGALAQGEERFRRAFDDNAVGMALLDLDGRYLRVNDALCRILGRSASSLLRLRLRDVVHADDLASTIEGLDRLGEGAPADHRTERLVRSDRETVWTTTTTTLIRDSSGAAVHFLQNVLDITAARRASAEQAARRTAEIATVAAEAANQAKSDFLAELSHELRTPLSSIVGYAELLRELDLPDERRSAALDAITESGRHIHALVDELLDLARIEARIVPLVIEPVPVGPLLAEVLAMVRPLALSRDVRLATPDDRTPPSVVRADRVKLRQVLLNFASNAVRYNRPGGRVDIRSETEGGWTRIAITDTGVGIPPEAQPLLFRPFARFAAPDEAPEGVGLGLAVSNRLVEAMGGLIEVTSRMGEGTTFTVVLPAAEHRARGTPATTGREAR